MEGFKDLYNPHQYAVLFLWQLRSPPYLIDDLIGILTLVEPCLYNEVHCVLHHYLCNLPSRLVQDELEVVLKDMISTGQRVCRRVQSLPWKAGCATGQRHAGR